MKKQLSAILLILVLAAGILLLLYPTVSNWWNRKVQTRAVASYKEAAEQLSEQDYSEIFEKAESYNIQLRRIGMNRFSHPELVSGYENILNITGTGIMGYVTIDKLDTELPIYHGTDPGVLQIAAGHLEGSSLPIGGKGNHSVISAHRGLPSSRLFTDLDEMEEGDVFTITVLDRMLTYQVDQILVVDPDELEALQMEEGKDYCSLMTCTPYGVNSQRLLVRGIRIPNKEADISADARRVRPLAVGTAAALPFAAAILILILREKRKQNK